MELEILISCMNQKDDSVVRRSKITSDALVINQCGRDGYSERKIGSAAVRMFDLDDKGLTKSRNFAIKHAMGDILLICDDDETFASDYENKIKKAYRTLQDADVIIFEVYGRKPRFKPKTRRLCYLDLMKVSSWQISFKRESILKSGVLFDENMGAGTGNGGEEEFKFLSDCRKKGLKIYYCPLKIAKVAQEKSTWFFGFDRTFFVNRGNTTRYIMGAPAATLYAVYYAFAKRKLFGDNISPLRALGFMLEGIKENRLAKLPKTALKQPKNGVI